MDKSIPYHVRSFEVVTSTGIALRSHRRYSPCSERLGARTGEQLKRAGGDSSVRHQSEPWRCGKVSIDKTSSLRLRRRGRLCWRAYISNIGLSRRVMMLRSKWACHSNRSEWYYFKRLVPRKSTSCTVQLWRLSYDRSIMTHFRAQSCNLR